MIHPRLSIAMADTPLPADGPVLVLNATPDCDLGAVPVERAHLVQAFRPDHDALAARGYAVMPTLPEGRAFSAAVVFIPRARRAAHHLIAMAAARVPAGAPIWVDGQKTDGIETILRDLKPHASGLEPYSKAHGKCAVFDNPGAAAFTGWTAHPTTPAPGFTALPGTFSSDAVDPGSALLAAHLPGDIKGRVADLGAGWGWLAAEVLARAPKVSEIHLIEADHDALTSARANIADPRAVFHWADATAIMGLPRIETVVMNPPFHRGRQGDPALGIAFIRKAAAMLPPNGTLWMVANRHLPYEATLRAVFGEVSEVAASSAFKVYRAMRPLRVTPGISPGTPPRRTPRHG